MAALLLGTFPSQAFATPSTYVLAVGSDRSFDSSLKSLKYSTLDSQRFARAMELVAKVPLRQIHVMNNASISEFRTQLVALANELEHNESVKRFILFYSGHSDERGLHFRDGLFPKDELHAFLKKIPSQTKISILDSCYSGALAAKGIEPAAEEFVVPRTDFDEPTGTVFLTASSADESAFESSKIEGSIFSNYLVLGLYGNADANGDGLVTIEELYQFVYQKTRYDNLILPHGAQQQPEFVSKLMGRGALVLSEPKTSLQPLRLGKKIGGEVKLYATYGLRSFTFPKDPSSVKTVQLPPGEYSLSVQDGNQVGQTVVKLDQVKLASVDYENLTWQTVRAPDNRSKGYERFATYSAEVGLHSGYLTAESTGPQAEISVAAGHFAAGLTSLHPYAAIFARANKLNTDYGVASVSDFGGMLGTRAFVDLGPPRLGFYGLAGIGIGILTQTWHYDEKDSLDAQYRANHPIAQAGLGSSYSLESGALLGLEYRREVVRIEDEQLGTQILAGNILGLTFTY